MRVDSFVHKFLGYGIHKSEVNIHILDHKKKKLIVFEDINQGTSVTNSAEQLATEVVSLKELNPREVIFAEYYPYYDNSPTIIELDYDPLSKSFKNPKWIPDIPDNLLNLITQTIEDVRIKEKS